MAIKLQSILTFWRGFELNVTQQELDETASEITNKQDESDVSRKKLVEQLKEFKKNLPDETKVLAGLIKSFQNEVDFLSKRSKFAETAFLKNYQKFLDICDPVPALEYSVGLEKKVCQQEEFELENKRLKLTIKEYKEELKDVKNQDITIKNLKEKIKIHEDKMDDTIKTKMKELEKEYASMYTQKEQIMSETHKHDMQKLKEAEERCLMLQSAWNQSQSELFEIKSKLEDITEAKSGEIEILMNDLERANQQVSATQKQMMQLQQRYESALAETGESKTSELDIKTFEVSSLETEIAGKDKEISQLITEIKILENSMEKLKNDSIMQVTSLQDELQEAKSKITKFESQISQMKDYDELKRELSIIKSIEFEGMDHDRANLSVETLASKPLELLLLEKNKALQNEGTSLKLKHEDIMSKYKDLDKEVTNLRTLNFEQQTLISQLEADLASVQSLSHGNQFDGSTQFTLISEAVRDLSPNNFQGSTASDSPSIAETVNTTDSLLSIVSAQRERFKMRNDELEMELAAKGSQLTLVQNELDSLRADNLKLYEKIRFLQSYEGHNRSSGESFSESQYSNQYEKSLDPFTSFSQKEKQRRYHSLSPFEKITLSIGHLVLNNKGARTASFIYVSLLHCLVFVVLYKFAYTESCKRDFYSDCTKKFAEHMHDVHGET